MKLELLAKCMVFDIYRDRSRNKFGCTCSVFIYTHMHMHTHIHTHTFLSSEHSQHPNLLHAILHEKEPGVLGRRLIPKLGEEGVRTCARKQGSAPPLKGNCQKEQKPAWVSFCGPSQGQFSTKLNK